MPLSSTAKARRTTPSSTLRLPAGGRDTPQGARCEWRLGVVNVCAVRRLEGHVSDVVCNLDGLAAGRRHLPDLILAGSVGAEVDPPAVSSEVGVAGFVHHSHAALAELRFDAVMVKRLAEH